MHLIWRFEKIHYLPKFEVVKLTSELFVPPLAVDAMTRTTYKVLPFNDFSTNSCCGGLTTIPGNRLVELETTWILSSNPHPIMGNI